MAVNNNRNASVLNNTQKAKLPIEGQTGAYRKENLLYNTPDMTDADAAIRRKAIESLGPDGYGNYMTQQGRWDAARASGITNEVDLTRIFGVTAPSGGGFTGETNHGNRGGGVKGRLQQSNYERTNAEMGDIAGWNQATIDKNTAEKELNDWRVAQDQAAADIEAKRRAAAQRRTDSFLTRGEGRGDANAPLIKDYLGVW
jgi:hypothetical protein